MLTQNRLSPSGPFTTEATSAREYGMLGNLPVATPIPAVNSTSAPAFLVAGAAKQVGKDFIYECGTDETATMEIRAHYPCSVATGRFVIGYSTWTAQPGQAGAWSPETPLFTELGADATTVDSVHVVQGVPQGRVKLRVLGGTTGAVAATAKGFAEVTDVRTDGWAFSLRVNVRKTAS